ncbi:MAG: protein phosphatase CheZ [Methylophilaceae bacterium]
MENNISSERGINAPNFHPAINGNEDMLNRIGQLTRGLHESIRALGVDKMIEKAAHEIPDARERLNYVAKMTEQAAERVLNATDIANPLQDEIAKGAQALHEHWNAVLEIPSVKSEYNQAAQETMVFIQKTIENSNATKTQLMEIMMAQDFQDLTGQVIKKITELAQNLEQQLVQLLIDFSPATAKKESDNNSLMNGPQISPETSVNVVSNQAQVDDLLDSLGF